MPSELICNEAFYMSGMDIDDLKDRLGITVYAQDAWYFDDVICEKTLKEHFHCGTLEGLGIGDYDCGMVAAGALLQYLKETQKTSLAPIAVFVLSSTHRSEPLFCFSRSVSHNSRFRLVELSRSMYFPVV